MPRPHFILNGRSFTVKSVFFPFYPISFSLRVDAICLDLSKHSHSRWSRPVSGVAGDTGWIPRENPFVSDLARFHTNEGVSFCTNYCCATRTLTRKVEKIKRHFVSRFEILTDNPIIDLGLTIVGLSGKEGVLCSHKFYWEVECAWSRAICFRKMSADLDQDWWI